MDKPNNITSLVFKESKNEEGLRFLQIFLEGEKEGRDITEALVQSPSEAPEGATLAEAWGFEMMQFIESYLSEQVSQRQLNGVLLKAPLKKNMN